VWRSPRYNCDDPTSGFDTLAGRTLEIHETAASTVREHMHRPDSQELRIPAPVLLLILGGALAACAPAPSADGPAESVGSIPAGLDNLNAVLWVQTAVEYRATSLQAYELARRAVDDALAEPGWSAALEQTDGFEGLPPAVILDIDETVLDNSFYEARLTLDGDVYAAESWDAWVMEEAATPIPGALDFTTSVADKGVTVFYVSNRRVHLEAATRANLRVHGFPLAEDVDTLLLRGEKPEWDSSDKASRRREIAAAYRILLMVGDNMGDFVSAAQGSVAERRAFADAHREYWSKGWITLANPTYGSWLGAVLDNDFSIPVEQQVEMKKKALDPRR